MAVLPALLTRRTLGRLLLHVILSANLLIQVALVVLGVALLVEPDSTRTVELLAEWSVIALLYVIAVAVAITLIARRPRTRSPQHPPPLYVSWVAQFVGAASTVIASVCGIAGAVEVSAVYSNAARDTVSDVVGTCAMLLSWLLLQWGYAQFYYRRHCRALRPVVEFPGGATPRLSDFVYFAFTVGTSFATSDAVILSPSLRWSVTKHSILSFFYNGAIIVLALNTLTAHH
ncbi:DUF1345 domain-containing protein [Leifsonia sp. 2TAF2]|uniref:DUF1345 domain-containing protein n=1 Tax=Leifsonia sp. 2TAF2 TaxID=3233009 RepID=UPI003F9C5ADC